MPEEPVDDSRRRLLLTATSVAGGAAASVAAIPFVGSMLPSDRAKAAGAPVEVEIGQLAAGQKVTSCDVRADRICAASVAKNEPPPIVICGYLLRRS